MKIGRRGMHGWVWTSQGFAKKPRRLRPAKSASKPIKRRKRRSRRISPAVPKPQRPVDAQAPQVAQEHGGAASVPPLATPTPRSPRKAWSGKYDDLGKLSKGEP
jgi:hypothetical protein